MQTRIEDCAYPAGSVRKTVIGRPWLLTILLASALCLAYMLAAFVHWGDVADRSLYANLGMIPIGLVAAILVGKAAANQPKRRGVWAWRILAAGLACFWAGDVLYFFYQNVLAVSPFPSPADAGYLAYYPLVFAGLLCFPHKPARYLLRVLAYPACLVLTAAGAIPVLVWFLLPTLQSAHDGLFAYSLSVGYPLGDILLLAGITWLLLRGAGTNRWSMWLLGVGLVIGLVADVLFGHESIQNTLQSGGLPDVGYMLSWTAFAWAGFAEVTRAQGSGR